MHKRSFASTLTRQWMLFAVVLSLLFAGMSLLALYILEDHFLDQKLRRVAQSLHAAPPPAIMPAGFELLSTAALPDDLREQFAGRSDGAHSEFRRANGRYVHALRTSLANGDSMLLVYDVTDEMSVNRALSRYGLYALMLILLFALIARLLARWFIGRWTRSTAQVLAQIRGSPSPTALRDYAAQEPIQEFAELAQRHADVWQGRVDMLAREQELLAFLAHELRTPLQSARTNLELIAATQPQSTAQTRLLRAIKRLERVSHSIRWLAEQSVENLPDLAQHPLLPIAPLLAELLEEFQPLAAQKGVSISLQRDGNLCWPVPVEVAETLLANLLLNALQHGDQRAIVITLDADAITIDNGILADHEASSRSGLGLQIVQRWAQRFDLQIARQHGDTSRYVMRVAVRTATTR